MLYEIYIKDNICIKYEEQEKYSFIKLSYFGYLICKYKFINMRLYFLKK